MSRTDKIIEKARDNKIFSICIIIVLLFLSSVSIIQGSIYIWDIFQKLRKPDLNVYFLKERQQGTEIVVHPRWKNTLAVDFSEPIPVQITLKNKGKVPATKIRIFLIYRRAVLRFERGNGHMVPIAILNETRNTFATDSISEYGIEEIQPSKISSIFEKDLNIRLRFRTVGAFPQVKNNVPFLPRIYIDFTDKETSDPKLLPVFYVITCNELSEPISGKLVLRIEDDIFDQISSLDYDKIDVKFDLKSEGQKPNLPSEFKVVSKKLKVVVRWSPKSEQCVKL